ncbi:hypothetical protein LZG72_07875 [Dyadobacter sp. CY323]|nr:hypothetical protein [Dyadobacter sp. CY323]
MTTENQTEKKNPTHTVFFLKDCGGDKPEWQKVGVGWEHKDGTGLNILVDSTGGQTPMTIRKNNPKE